MARNLREAAEAKQETDTVEELEPTEPKVRVETEERFLRCDLTPEEFSDKTYELTRAIDEAADAEAQKKAVAAQLKSTIEEAMARVSRLNNIVRNRYEMRHIECAVAYDYDTFKVRITRKDTGEEIEDREMKVVERERQRDLFPDEEDAA